MATKIMYKIKFSQEPLNEDEKTATLSLRKEVENALHGTTSNMAKMILSQWLNMQRSNREELKTKGDVERSILKQLVNMYGRKSADDANAMAIAADLIDRIRYANDEILLDKTDKDAVDSGVGLSKNMRLGNGEIGRPEGWLMYPELWRQLRNPETVETE